jgi:integrase/recombinase XerD
VLDVITEGVSEATGRQYRLRMKSLLNYANRLGYTQFNAGAAMRVSSDARSRGANLAKRIISEVDVALLIRGTRSNRNRIMLQVLYAGGLWVSELVGLNWGDVIHREGGQVQLSAHGKGGIIRQVPLPEAVSRSLLELRVVDISTTAPVFASSRRGGRLVPRAVVGIVKRAAKRAGLKPSLSPHWLRHVHASHAIDRGATLPEVQATLGHTNIATTSGYLHARPESSSASS